MKSKIVLVAGIVLMAALSPALANDWPQFRGPDRTGVSRETGLLKAWPMGGPKLAWKAANLGAGYSAPAVVMGRIYLLSAMGNDEHVLALNEKDGSKLWSKKIGTVGPNNGPQHLGPRGTPTVVGDHLYALASGGDLVCVELSKGDIVWSKNLMRDFGGSPGKWAYSESPLVDGDVVVVSPGGPNMTVVALNKKGGSLVWKSAVPGGDKAAYGSPIVADAAGMRQYVVFLSGGIVGVSAQDGKYLWRYNNSANKTANIPTPIYFSGHVFSASGYGTGGGLAKLDVANDKVTATPVWFKNELISQIGGFVRVGEYLYGCAGGKAVNLVCVDFMSGNIVWRKPCVGAGAVSAVDGMLYVRGQGGTMALVEATPEGYKEQGRFAQPDRDKREPAWPYPVVANGCLYLRDMGVLLCYDVRDPKAKN